jgi:hypothetical protein
MSAAPKWPGILLGLALTVPLAGQEPQYKFSTTVFGRPLDTFGTTIASNSGFRGDIYFLQPGASKLPNFSKLEPVGSIFTPYLCVPARAFEEGFPGVTDRFEWFAIDYTARFWISQPGTYRFALTSDDGSVLYIDNKRVIQNDGVHPLIEKEGKLKLSAGAHRIRVSYFQGPRFHVALVLQVARPAEREYHVFHTGEFKPPPDGVW